MPNHKISTFKIETGQSINPRDLKSWVESDIDFWARFMPSNALRVGVTRHKGYIELFTTAEPITLAAARELAKASFTDQSQK